MLDKMLGVSPPQKGLAQDSNEGVVDKRTLQQHADLKKEFDQKLKSQMQDKDKSSTAKEQRPQDQKPKIERDRDKDELKADRNQKKPSGGPKKKMVEPDEQSEQTISNVMASIESEVEIPEDRKILAQVENESSSEKQNKISDVGFKTAAMGLAASVIKDAAAKGQPQQANGVATVSTEKVLANQALLQQALSGKKVVTAQGVALTPEMIAAFKAAAENAQNKTGVANQATTQTDQQQAQLMAQLQQALQNGKQPTQAQSQGQSSSDDKVAASALIAKSLENLKGSAAGAMAMPNVLQAQTQQMQQAQMAAANDGIVIPSQAPQMSAQEQMQLASQIESAPEAEIPPAMMMAGGLQALAQQQQPKEKELSFEQQLQAEVGFNSEDDGDDKKSIEDDKATVKGGVLLEKMKAFEAEKGLSPQQANAFEAKVLNMLQMERNELVHQKYNQLSDIADKKHSADLSSSADSMMNAKALTPDAALHAGQNDFRTQINSSLDKMTHAPGAVSPQAMMEHREENIQQVMNGAKYLVNKGGGEMLVKMSPDGMGPIALKVMMQDGKVNIQMQTQDKSVKKLIEDSLTELKSGLAAQRIHLDHVKIDTVNATNTENSTQFQAQHNGSDAQGRQQEFWKQFRENFGNQARRNSYNEVGAVPQRQASEPAALRPVKTSGARGDGRTGSTLNRIA